MSALPCEPTIIGAVIAEDDPYSGPRLVAALQRHFPEPRFALAGLSRELLLGPITRFPVDVSELRNRMVAELVAHPMEKLAECRLLVVPNLMPRLLPVVAYALMKGVPVLALRTPLAHELLGSGALLVDVETDGAELSQQIRNLCEDPLLRQSLVLSGRNRLPEVMRRLSALSDRSAPKVAQCRSGETAGKRSLPGEMMAAPIGLTVIIPTRGGAPLERCLRALKKAAGGLNLQTIAVITGGLSGRLPPCDEVVRCDPPFVWSKANNAGLTVARHPFVLFLNDDCYFRRTGDLERLVRDLQHCGHLVALGPRGSGLPPTWDQSTLSSNIGIRETRFSLSGACFLARREAFAVAGGFDEQYVTYGCDEVEWFYRLRRQGYRWAVHTNIAVEHAVSTSFTRDRARIELPESRRLFYQSHGVQAEDGPQWDPPECDLSWIIASRNNAGHLARCLESISAQTSAYSGSVEVVLALDGCTDSSAEVAQAVNDALPAPLPLRIIHFPTPAGSAARAKNRAIRLARGKVHLLMDDDDASLPGRAELVRALNGADRVAVGNYWKVGLDGSVVLVRPGPFQLPEIIAGRYEPWGPWATAIPAELWRRCGLHCEDYPGSEDLELWLRWMRDGVVFQHVDTPVHLYLVRQRGTAVSSAHLGLRNRILESYRLGTGTPALGMKSLDRRVHRRAAVRKQARTRPALASATLAQVCAVRSARFRTIHDPFRRSPRCSRRISMAHPAAFQAPHRP